MRRLFSCWPSGSNSPSRWGSSRQVMVFSPPIRSEKRHRSPDFAASLCQRTSIPPLQKSGSISWSLRGSNTTPKQLPKCLPNKVCNRTEKGFIRLRLRFYRLKLRPCLVEIVVVPNRNRTFLLCLKRTDKRGGSAKEKTL